MLPLHLQPESHIPLYVQLRDQLRALVHSGELRTGDRIPASRELAGATGRASDHCGECLCRTRIRRADQGHVGRGTFICAMADCDSSRRRPAEQRQRRRAALGIIFCRRARRRRPEPPDAASSARAPSRLPARGLPRNFSRSKNSGAAANAVMRKRRPPHPAVRTDAMATNR